MNRFIDRWCYMHFLIFQIDFVRAWTCIDHIIAGFTARIRSERKGNVFSCAAQSVCSQGREEGSHVTSTHDDIGQSQVTSGPPPPDRLELVHLRTPTDPDTSICKRAVGLRLKGLLVPRTVFNTCGKKTLTAQESSCGRSIHVHEPEKGCAGFVRNSCK